MLGKPIRLVYDEKTKKFELREVESIYHAFLYQMVPGLDLPLILWEGIRYVVDRFNSPGNLTQDDAENIRKIIEEGRNQKVDEMEMEMSRNVTTGFSIDGIKGAEITLGSKGESKYVMKVKYKYDE